MLPNVWALGLCFDKDGRLWVAEGVKNRVLRWDHPADLTVAAPPDGIIGHTYSSGTPTTANEASIFLPYSVTVDAAGTLWVLDFQLQRILRFDQAALRSGDIPADGMLGKSSFTDMSTSGLPGRFYRATQAQIDHEGNLWVMDTSGVDEIGGGSGDRIRLFKYNNPSAKLPGDMPDVTIRFSNAATGAHSFVVTPDNSLWVAFSVGGYQIHRFANLQAPAVSSVGAGPPGMTPTAFGGRLNALSTDSEGHLWVTDPLNNRVMRFKDGADAAPGALSIAATELKVQGLEISFTAVPLRYYVVESSSDLQNWTGRLFLQASTGLETYSEPAPLAGRAFYRIKEQP